MKTMKTFFLSTLMFMSFPALKAQTYDTTTFYGKQNYIFAPLDKTKITTGLLREYGIDFTNPDNYVVKPYTIAIG